MNIIQKLFCSASGADLQYLRGCPQTERTKYFCEGFIIILLTLLSGSSVYFALIYIFPLPDTASSFNKVSNVAFSLTLSVCWALVVYNSYRLTLASTGFGDGKSLIEADELRSAIPKFLLAIVIGLLTATLLTVATLHRDAKHEPTATQIFLLNKMNSAIDIQTASNIKELYVQQVELASQRQIISSRLAKLEKNAKNLTMFNNEQLSLRTQLSEIDKKLAGIQTKTQNTRQEVQRLKIQSEKNLVNSESVLTELDLAVERHTSVAILIDLFILIIYLAPFIIRVLWAKGPYEYLLEFQNTLLLSKLGIAPKAHSVRVDNDTHWVDRFTVAEKILNHVLKQQREHRKANHLNQLETYQVSINKIHDNN